MDLNERQEIAELFSEKTGKQFGSELNEDDRIESNDGKFELETHYYETEQMYRVIVHDRETEQEIVRGTGSTIDKAIAECVDNINESYKTVDQKVSKIQAMARSIKSLRPDE